MELRSWDLGKTYVAFCNLGKAGLFASFVDIPSLGPIPQFLFFVAGIIFGLVASQVKAALESGLIISIKTMNYKLRCLECKKESMTIQEVSLPNPIFITLV